MVGIGRTDRLRDAVAGERLQIGIAFRPELADSARAARRRSRRCVIGRRLERAAHVIGIGHAQIGGGGNPERAGRAELGIDRSEEHTSELQSLMRISYAVFCLKKKKTIKKY